MPDKTKSLFAPLRPSAAPLQAPQPAPAQQVPGASQAPAYQRYDIAVILTIAEAIPSEPGVGIVRSKLSAEGARQIHLTLSRANLLTTKALARVDTTSVKFFAGLLLAEYAQFWLKLDDGRRLVRALKAAAGIPPGDRLWWNSLAAALAKSPLLMALDKLPIFGPNGQSGPFQLFSFEVVLREQTQIHGWVPRA
jgi:hypothetical protein